jgi:Lar family restriction alleviation protein
MTSKLRECPFCGCRDVWPVPALQRSWQVECPQCGARGPTRVNVIQAQDRLVGAVAAWNKRVGDDEKVR